MKYNLTLTEKQAGVLIDALDLYTRIGLGQFEEVVQVYDRNLKLDHETRDRIKSLLDAAKREAGHPSNGSYGIHNEKVDDVFRAAFDIKQVVRNKLAWDRNPKGGIQVQFDKPDPISQMGLPTIEKSSVIDEEFEEPS
jgi:hypothetical protein